MEKKGLSDILIAIILVLISIAAISLVWVVLKNFLYTTTSQTQTSCLYADLEIKEVLINKSDNLIHVKIKRNVGDVNLTKIKFKFYNSTGAFLKENETNMGEFSIKTFTFYFENVSDINKVEIAPVIFVNGKENICRIISSKKLKEFKNVVGENIGQRCGNGECESGEDSSNCPEDCQQTPNPTLFALYLPNMTGGQAWKDDVISYITGLDEITTAYTQTQLNEISEEDGGYVSQDYIDGPECYALTSVNDCSSLTGDNCGGHYQTSDNYFCAWVGMDIDMGMCVGVAPCMTIPYHQIKFKISEDPNNINNVSVRVASKHSGNTINLLAWNFTSGKFVKLWSGSYIPNTLFNATGTIYDADNFINSSGDFYIAFNTTYGVGAIFIDYAEVKVN